MINFKISRKKFLFERSFQNWEVLALCVCAGLTVLSFLELVTLQLAAISGKPCSTETYSLFKTSFIKTAGLLAESCPCQGRWACTTTLFSGYSVTGAGLCSWYATGSCTTAPFWPVAQFAVNCFTTIALPSFDKVVRALCSTTGWLWYNRSWSTLRALLSTLVCTAITPVWPLSDITVFHWTWRGSTTTTASSPSVTVRS